MSTEKNNIYLTLFVLNQQAPVLFCFCHFHFSTSYKRKNVRVLSTTHPTHLHQALRLPWCRCALPHLVGVTLFASQGSTLVTSSFFGIFLTFFIIILKHVYFPILFYNHQLQSFLSLHFAFFS